MATNRMKIGTVILLIFSMMFSSFNFVSAAESIKSDVKGHWAETQLNAWLEKGLIKGYADGTVKPDNPITRAELISLINRALGFTEKADVIFSDIQSNNWAYGDVAIAIKADYIKGNSDGTFAPGKQTSRQEVAVIIARLLKLQADDQNAVTFSDADRFASWSQAAIGAVAAKKIMQGYGDQSFKPDAQITRAEAVVTLDRALQALQTQFESQKNVYNAAGTYGPVSGTENVSGDVVVNVSGVTLQNMVINGNLLLAAGIGSGDAFLKNVTVKGTTTVQGGGDHSIHFENGIFGKVIVDKKDGTVRLAMEEPTIIDELRIKTPVKLELGKDSKIGMLLIDALLNVQGQGTIEKAIIGDEGKGSTFEKQPQKLEGPGAPTPTSNNSNGEGNVVPSLSSAKVITAFGFVVQTGAATINANNHTVDIKVINGTNPNGLVASFTLSAGASAKVGAAVQTSGTTGNDFSNAVTYTVTAQDGSTQDWTVSVAVATTLNNENEVKSFSFPEQVVGTTAMINHTSHTILIQVKNGTNLNGLVATYTLSAGATAKVGIAAQNSGITANNFTNQVTYTVTAQDTTSTQNWTVNVTVAAALSSAKAITGTTIGVISNGNIINVPAGTKVSALKAALSVSPNATAEILVGAGGMAVTNQSSTDVTATMVIEVTAEDASTAEYSITMAGVVLSSAKAITAFSFAEEFAAATINQNTHTVDIEVINGTNLNGLVGSFTLSAGATAKVGATAQASGTTANDFSNTVTYTVTAEDNTTQTWKVTVTVAAVLSSVKAITAFSFPQQAGAVTINANNHTVDIKVPNGTNQGSLVATFTLSAGATAEVAGMAQTSGTTSNAFFGSLLYTVIAQDNSTQDWTVNVTIASSAKAITVFSFPQQTGPATIDSNNHTVDIQVANGTQLNALIATFTSSAGATAKVGKVTQTSGTTSNDFSNQVTYIVTAEDNSTQSWTVTVSVALSSAKDITSFSFPQQVGAATIDANNHIVLIEVVSGTDLSNLVASFTLSAGATATIGSVAQTSGTTANDFSQGGVYTVTAEDGSTQIWGVEVETQLIMAFSFPQQTGEATIDWSTDSIKIQVANGTDLTNLVATFTLASGAIARINQIEQSSGTSQNDFSNGVIYAVTALNGNTQIWSVIITVKPIPALSATAEQGATPGYSQLTNVAASSGNHLYVLPWASILPTPNIGDAAPNGNAAELDNYSAGTEFPASSFYKYVHIYEVDSNGKVVQFQLITLTAADIKPIPIGDQAPIVSATAAPGSAPGTTKIIAAPFGSGNHIAIKIGFSTVGMVLVGDSLPAGPTVLNNYMGDEITGMDITTNKFIVVYEVDSADIIVAYNEIVLIASNITPVGSPMLSTTVLPGTAMGTTSVTATVSTPLNHLVVYGSDSVIPAPNIGDSEPVAFTVVLISPYTSGADISFMDAVTNKYVAVYEANTAGAIVKYQLITLTAGDMKPMPAATITPDTTTVNEAFNNIGQLNGGSIALALTNSTFVAGAADVTGDVIINGLPAGLSYTATLANSGKINVDITGAATNHAAIDSTTIMITVKAVLINGAANDIVINNIQFVFED